MAFPDLGISTYVLTISHLIQSGIIICIIVELYYIIVGDKKSNISANKSDFLKNVGDKLFGRDEKEIERANNDEAKIEKKSEDDLKQIERIEADEASLLNDADTTIREVDKNEKEMIQKVQEPSFNPSSISSNVSAMIMSLTKLNEDIRRMFKITQRLRFIEQNFSKDVTKGIITDEETKLKSYMNQIKIVKKELEETTDENKKRIFAEKLEKANVQFGNKSRNLITLKGLCTTLEQNVEKHKDNLRKMVVVERRTMSEINTLINDSKKIQITLKSMIDDPSKIDKQKKKLFDDIRLIHTDLQKYYQEWNEIKHSNSSLIRSLNQDIINPYKQIIMHVKHEANQEQLND